LDVGLTGLLCSVLFSPATLVHQDFVAALPSLGLIAALYFAIDVGIMLGLMALLGNGSPWQVWQEVYRHTALAELGAGSLGVLLAITWTFNFAAIALLALPVAAMRNAFKAHARAEERAEALRKRGSQLETVLALGRQLRLHLARADLLQAVAGATRTIVRAESVTGYLRDEQYPEQLRRAALAPPDATRMGPAQLATATVSRPTAADEFHIAIEPEGEGVSGLLLVSGTPATFSRAGDDVLAILTTQAAIALTNASLHERALALADRDSLTELLNRRAVQTRLEEEVARALRGKRPLCLVMIDLDDFGAVNDTYGHHVGDVTLRAAARALATSARAMDIVARYGGDEYLALLPETSLEQGLDVTRRICQAIAALHVTEGPASVRITASAGVAALPTHGQTPGDLLRAADQATYAAKHAGKGRVALPEDAMLALDADPVELAKQLAHANMATVAALAAAVDAKDTYTQGHAQRVAGYAAALAACLGLGASDIARIQLAGQLHDVGKIGIQDSLLTKPGKLSADEYALIQQHTVIGERMLAGVPFLREILPALRHHHERWDGEGYPDKLCNGSIPRDAAILAIADAFDAMTSDRPYRAALPLAEARRRIQEESGAQFDPVLAGAFDKAIISGAIDVLAAPRDELSRGFQEAI